MADYNVGNINIGIKTVNKDSVSNIKEVITQINKLSAIEKKIQDSFISVNKLANGLYKIQKLDLSNITNQFSQISSATKLLNDNLSAIEQPKFGETATALNRLTNAFRQLDKLKDFDFRKMYNSFSALNRILTPFLDKLKQSEASLAALNGVLGNLKAKTITKATNEVKKLDQETKNTSNSGQNLNKTFKNVFSIGKIYFFLNYFKRVGQAILNVMTTSIDFEETLNKFQVSYANFSDKATSFANNMAYAFNLSRESLMNYMSTFNSMLKSLEGLTTEEAYNLSTTLTQLSLDYASLFNVTVESSMTAFQAVLSGQIRTIRNVSGIDVSENTIYQYYQELGGTKSIRQLDQLEKRLLRIYALERQMNELGAVGDLEKTINSSANLIKQFQETVKELKVYLGNLARDYFYPVLKYATATVLILKDMAKALAETRNALTPEYGEGQVDLFGEIEESADSASETVDELQGRLSFDKFEALSSTNTGLGVELENLISAIKNYSTDFANVESNARKIADNVLTWLGYMKEVDPVSEEVSWHLEDSFNNLEKIKTLVVFFTTLGIGVMLTKLIAQLQAIAIAQTSVGGAVAFTQVATTGLFAVAGAFLLLGSQLSTNVKIIAGALGTLLPIIIAITMAAAGLKGITYLGVYAGLLATSLAAIPVMVQGLKEKNWFANGGFPEQGQMFIANEKGPELVGTMDGKSAVANNNMIVEGIEEASYRGFMRAMSKGGNSTNINLNVEGVSTNELARVLFKPMVEEAKRNGYNINRE